MQLVKETSHQAEFVSTYANGLEIVKFEGRGTSFGNVQFALRAIGTDSYEIISANTLIGAKRKITYSMMKRVMNSVR